MADTDRRVLVAIARAAHEGEVPSVRYLAAGAEVSRNTAHEAVRRLVVRGLVRPVGGALQARGVVPTDAGWSEVAVVAPQLVALPLARRIALLTEEQRAALLDLVDLMETENRESGWRRVG